MKQGLMIGYGAATATMWATYAGFRIKNQPKCLQWNKLPHEPDFDIERYMGRWFELQRNKYLTFELGGECVYVEYSLNSNGVVNVTNTLYNPKKGKYEPIKGNGVANKWQSGNLGIMFFFFMPRGDYNVIATDYDNYAVIYACQPSLAGSAGD